MTTVLWDSAGFVVDWNWQQRLTVWTLAGPRLTCRFDRRLHEHELAARPADERQAQAAAGRWWRAGGRSESLERRREHG